MKTIIALLWAASVGAVLWAPWFGPVEGAPIAPKAAIAPSLVPSVRDEEPATWMLVLIGAAVVCFVAARRAD
jgi:hypothetical protein